MERRYGRFEDAWTRERLEKDKAQFWDVVALLAFIAIAVSWMAFIIVQVTAQRVAAGDWWAPWVVGTAAAVGLPYIVWLPLRWRAEMRAA